MRFESARLRLERAKDTTAELAKRIDGFIRKHPPTAIVEGNAPRGRFALKLRFSPLPKEWPVVVAEISEHLRHALDQATFAASAAATGQEPKAAYFPFSDTPEGLENTIKGRCGDVPAAILDVARAFKPYRTGNIQLWGLNKAANTKHTRLMPVSVLSSGTYFKNITVDSAMEFQLLVPRWDRGNNEIVLLRAAGVSNLRYEISVDFTIAFDNAEPLGSQPLVPTLNSLGEEVTRIVDAIESETDRHWRSP